MIQFWAQSQAFSFYVEIEKEREKKKKPKQNLTTRLQTKSDLMGEFQISGLYQGEVKAYVLVSFQDKYPSSFQLKA